MNPEQNNQNNEAPQVFTSPTPSAPAPISPAGPQPAPVPGPQAAFNPSQIESDKEYLAAVLFAWFLGGFGADRFYLGKTGTAIAKLLTLGGLGLWAFYDVVMLVFGKTRDTQGRQLKDYEKFKKPVKITFFILLVVQIISLFLAGIILMSTLATFQNVQTQARDIERETDIKATFSQLEAYYAGYGSYPSLDELNDANFRDQYLVGLDTEVVIDPTRLGTEYSSRPEAGRYAYEPTPAGCASQKSGAVPCSDYTLTATLDDGSAYEKRSLGSF